MGGSAPGKGTDLAGEAAEHLPSFSASIAPSFDWQPGLIQIQQAYINWQNTYVQCCRDKLMRSVVPGSTFTLSVQRQSNIIVVATRALDASTLQHSATDLQDAAGVAGQAANYMFDCYARSCRGLTLI